MNVSRILGMFLLLMVSALSRAIDELVVEKTESDKNVVVSPARLSAVWPWVVPTVGAAICYELVVCSFGKSRALSVDQSKQGGEERGILSSSAGTPNLPCPIPSGSEEGFSEDEVSRTDLQQGSNSGELLPPPTKGGSSEEGDSSLRSGEYVSTWRWQELARMYKEALKGGPNAMKAYYAQVMRKQAQDENGGAGAGVADGRGRRSSLSSCRALPPVPNSVASSGDHKCRPWRLSYLNLEMRSDGTYPTDRDSRGWIRPHPHNRESADPYCTPGGDD